MRQAVAHLKAAFEVSERRACSIIKADRKSVRYRSCRQPDTALRERLIRPRFLEHPRLEFSGPSQGDRLAMSPGFISVIGVLLPMAPWGRSSL